MNLVNVTLDNLTKEHSCCAITEKKGEQCIASKNAWLKERMEDGLVFSKADIRGKVFIEYILAEHACSSVDAPYYMFIDCFWLSEQCKGQEIPNRLLNRCIQDAKNKGKDGQVILSSKKKMSYLSALNHLLYKGCQISDEAGVFSHCAFPFKEGLDNPSFKHHETMDKGYVLYYARQYPHTIKYVDIFKQAFKEANVPIQNHLTTTLEAQICPAPSTKYALFHNGKFIINKILSNKKIEASLVS